MKPGRVQPLPALAGVLMAVGGTSALFYGMNVLDVVASAPRAYADDLWGRLLSSLQVVGLGAILWVLAHHAGARRND